MAITGTVKWHNDRLGYGFLQREDREDVFVHYTEVENEESLDDSDVRSQLGGVANISHYCSETFMSSPFCVRWRTNVFGICSDFVPQRDTEFTLSLCEEQFREAVLAYDDDVVISSACGALRSYERLRDICKMFLVSMMDRLGGHHRHRLIIAARVR